MIYGREKHADEMCIFYLMYYTDYKGFLKDLRCFKELYDERKFSWEDDLPGKSPENSENLDGVDLFDKALELP